MYERTIAELVTRNEEISRKLPTIDESIKTYEQMVKNYQHEKEELINTLKDNEEVIAFLKRKDLD